MTRDELTKLHPDYTYSLDSWQFFVRSYYGGKRYKDGDYLLQHPFESTDNYTRRKDSAYFYNFCSPVVDIFVSLLYKDDPTRDYGSLKGDVLFESFLGDADLEGNTYAQFVREANRFASIYGRVSVIVDKPSISVETQAEANDEDIRPYLNLITPENITNWTHVRLPNGRVVLDSVTIVEEWAGSDAKRVRIWNRVSWELHELLDNEDETLSPVESGRHGLGVVPIVNFYNKNTTQRMSGISDIEDISDINKNIYYLCSDSKEIIENTAFPMLAVPYEKGGGTDEKEVGPKNLLQFDPAEANAKPYWLEAPHSSLAEIRQWIGQDVLHIYKISNLAGIKNSGEGTQPWSAVALEVENKQRHAVLSEKAANAEQFENKILNLYALWEGKEFDGSVTYSKDYSLTDVNQNTRAVIDAMRDVSDKLSSDVHKTELEKQLAMNILSTSLSADEMKKVIDDIDKQPQPKTEEGTNV